MHPISFLAFLT
ncbi:hypothetical protein D027_4139A, partial [Vibrio parahaemolyticus 861]